MTRRRPITTTTALYSTSDVARMIGATYRQVDHWARKGYIPGQAAGAGTGSGHYRRWTQADVEAARLLALAAWLRVQNLGHIVEVITRSREVLALIHALDAERTSLPEPDPTTRRQLMAAP